MSYEVVDLGGRIVTETTPVVAGPRGPGIPPPAAGTYPDGTSLVLIVDSTNPNGYRWAEGSATAPAPTVTDALTTEAGDTLTTEFGDILVHA